MWAKLVQPESISAENKIFLLIQQEFNSIPQALAASAPPLRIRTYKYLKVFYFWPARRLENNTSDTDESGPLLRRPGVIARIDPVPVLLLQWVVVYKNTRV